MSEASRIRTVARLEFVDLVRRPIWWVLVVAALTVTLALSGTAFLPRGDHIAGGVEPFVNSQYAIAAFFALSSMVLYTLFAAILAGLGIIRDDEHRVSPLIHSTPLDAGEYVTGKFTGALAALVLVLLVQTAFAAACYEVLELGGGPTGPFNLANYVIPALAFGLPSILLFAGVAFAIGEWTRRSVAVSTVPIALVFSLPFFLTWGPPDLSPALETLLQILDPSGLRWYTRVALDGPPSVAFVNASALPWDLVFILNRLLVIGIGVGAVASTVPHCRRVIGGGGRTPTAAGPAERGRRRTPLPEGRAATPTAPLLMQTAPAHVWSSLLALTQAELRELVAQPALYIFAPLGMALVWQEGSSAFGPFDEALILTAGNMAVGTLSLVTLLGCVVLLFHTVESLHRERATGFDRILYSLPFPTGSLLIAKNLASAVLMLAVLLAAVGTVLAMMARQPQGRMEVVPLLIVWGLVMVPSFVVWNSFVTLLWATLRNRYTVYGAGLVALLLTVRSLRHDSISWISNWTASGTLRWSDMGTFDLNGSALILNRLLVMAVSVFFTGVALRAFARSERDATSFASLMRLPTLGRAGLALMPVALVPLLLGGVLHRRISGGFQGPQAAQVDQRYWLRNSGEWSDMTPPEIRHVDLFVDVDPARRFIAIEGTYRLEHVGPEPVIELPFTVRPPFGSVVWSVRGSAVPSEDRFGLHVLTLPGPLEPGAETIVGFSFEAIYPRGFTKNGGGVSQFVLPSGVVLHTLRNSFLPTPGFVEGIGRTRENLPDPSPYPGDFWKTAQTSSRPYTTRVTIRAPSAYTMNAPGALMTRSESRGSTTVVWETEHPVGAVNIVGGKWQVRRDGETAVFFHPEHAYNVDEILSTLVAARKRFSEWFYPYPWRELKLSEYPNQDLNAMGFPTNIPFSEGLGFLARGDSLDRPAFFVTAHEAAHQWWGNILSAGVGPGTDHLVEGMASYSALLLSDAEHGPEARRRFSRVMESHYVERRRVDRERPVGRMLGDQAPSDWTVVYEKGAWVQWMLQEHIGRDAMLQGLRRFVAHYARGDVRPTLQHMLQFLRKEAPDTTAYDAFVEQWFFDIVLPEFRITDVALRRDDGWIASAAISNVGTGQVSVEVVATGGEYRRSTQVVTLAAGQTKRLSWTLDFEPDRIVVDPDVRVLQDNRTRAEAVF